MKTFVVAISGGSGAPYALRLIELLLRAGHQVKSIVSPAGQKILEIETGIELGGTLQDKQEALRRALRIDTAEVGFELYDHQDVAAPISSGSFAHDGLVIVPCSMGTLGRIANGISSDLVSRAADVVLKERRKLIVVPRETPLSEIHIRNMLAVTRAGGVVMPAAPGFYHKPKTIDDIVNMIVSRILDHLGVDNSIFDRWKGEGIARFLAVDE
jgi:4-hydroxy-3-polyprenylbenzoate decarboxylase